MACSLFQCTTKDNFSSQKQSRLESKKDHTSAQAKKTPEALKTSTQAVHCKKNTSFPSQSTQLIMVIAKDWNTSDARLYRFERQLGSPWQPIAQNFPVTLGYAGMAWGLGLHRMPQTSGPKKQEGDGKSPAGMFSLGQSYGYHSMSKPSAFPYQKISKTWRCVDDPNSGHYNRVLDLKTVEPDWQRSEVMLRKDSLYEIVIEINHNHLASSTSKPTPQSGSCIFMHVWNSPVDSTIGCTAMPLSSIEALRNWLDPDKVPIYIALPTSVYQEFQQKWELPNHQLINGLEF